VTLYESASRTGGQVLLAELLPGRGEFGGVATNLLAEAERAGVRIVTGQRVDAALVAGEAPDAVIVATGGRPRRPPLEVHGTPVVLDAWEVLRGAALPTGHVVVADWRCDWVGPGLAELAARAGRRVTLAVNGYMPGQRLQQYVRDDLLARLHRLHVTVVPTARLFGVDADTVYLQHTTSGEPMVIEDVSGLLLAQGQVADDDLATELDGLVAEMVLIGDCLAPRTVEEAVLEGLEAGAAV
jgi:pyruvate/2-oxoglutarate dehydrogenase complex dihydrolipoamide dehydrogenase (E3) component